jgi:hypothetical protein
LQHYHTPPPTDADARIGAVRASLGFLSVAPDRISVPMLAAVYRAPLGETDFSLFLTGRTGTFNTTLAALCQQHFGAGMDACRLPGHFACTANALEELAFQAKDALLVIDDFAPTGGAGDAGLEALAERLFRAAGNGQGRSRMRGSQLRAGRPPRALLLATGERVPGGHSIRARLLTVEVRAGDVDRAALSECQMAAQQGRLAAAMGAYLAWITRDYENRQSLRSRRWRELRGDAPVTASVIHARLPGIVAELQSAWEIWLQFGLEVGAIHSAEQVELAERGRQALEEVTASQAPYHVASHPALGFLSLLRAALVGGRAHVADRRGARRNCPSDGAGGASQKLGCGSRRGSELAGSVAATFFWNRRQAMRWPSNWPGRRASPSVCRHSVSDCIPGPRHRDNSAGTQQILGTPVPPLADATRASPEGITVKLEKYVHRSVFCCREVS